MLRISAMLFAGLLLAEAVARPDEPAKPAEKKPDEALPAFAAAFRVLKGEVAAKMDKYYEGTDKEYQAAKNEAERSAVLKRMREGSRKIQRPAAERAMALVRPHAADPAAVDALVWVVERGSPALAEEAAAALTKHHAVDPMTISLACRNRGCPLKWAEPLLRAQLARADLPKPSRPRVLLSLAVLRKTRSELPAMISESDDELMADLEGIYGAEALAGFRKIDVAAAEAEAIKLFGELAEKHGSETLAGEMTYGAFVEASVYEIRNLSLGKTAPDIRGEDTDGAKLALSDYRGRVVLLTFWGTWCGPCMELVPHERELVDRFRGKPFAIVGVNSDADKAPLKVEIAKAKITWRSFWCGEKGPEGAIPAAWNVTSWPTLYVLDHQGVIRAKQLRGASLDRLLEKLVAEAGAAK